MRNNPRSSSHSKNQAFPQISREVIEHETFRMSLLFKSEVCIYYKSEFRKER